MGLRYIWTKDSSGKVSIYIQFKLVVSTHLKSWVKMGIFPKFRGENKKYLSCHPRPSNVEKIFVVPCGTCSPQTSIACRKTSPFNVRCCHPSWRCEYFLQISQQHIALYQNILAMYGKFTYIYYKSKHNVGKYYVHGAYMGCIWYNIELQKSCRGIRFSSIGEQSSSTFIKVTEFSFRFWNYPYLRYLSSWWLNQPIWKICSSNWKSPPSCSLYTCH